MMLYIIKSTVILGILLFFHHFFLEKEKMHQFNRFYLLSGIFLALLTPLITVKHITAPNIIYQLDPNIENVDSSVLGSIASQVNDINWVALLWIGYLTIAFIFLLKFLYNFSSLLNKAYHNEQIRYAGLRYVLIEESVLPHTFLNYVFVNRTEFENQQIEEELYTHENTHAIQWHSLDVILIEIVQVLFWFNPLISIYKKAIQLNHEFLADESVIDRHHNTSDYQHLLVDKAGNNNRVHLASNLNFSVTKKRLTMMTKSSNRWRMSLYAISSIPLFICLLMLFGNQAYAQTNNHKTPAQESELDKDLETVTILWKSKNGTVVYKSYNKLNAEQKNRIKSLIPPPPPPREGQDPATIKKVPVVPKNSIIEFDEIKNTVQRIKDLYSIPPPPPPKPPKAPKAPKNIKPPKAPKAPKAVKPVKAPKAPKPPKAPSNLAPPPPPPPPAPLDAAIDMAKNGGTFSLNGKMVDSDKAIAILKNNDQVKTVHVKIQSDGKRLMIITTKN